MTYSNDVDEDVGGGTHFGHYDITVQPKRENNWIL
jgi:hypothetical protein